MSVRALLFAGALFVAMPVQAQNTQDQPGATDVPPASSTDSNDQASLRSVVTDVLGSVLTGPSWNLGISLFGGYNQTNVSSSSSVGGTLASLVRSGATAGGSTQFSTFTALRRVSLGIGAGSSTNYFRSTSRFLTSYNASASQSITLGRRTTVSAGETFSYTPFYALNQFLGLQNFAGTQLTMPVQGTFDSAIGDMRQYRYTAQAQMSHPFTDRTSVALTYAADLTGLDDPKPIRHYQQGGFRFTHMIGQGIGYHMGYGYGQATFIGIADPTVFHNIDVGLNLNKALSISRRTTFSFSTGTAVNRNASEDRVGQGGTPIPGQTRTYFNVIGQASLTHNIGRSWNARVNYGRTWQMIDGSYVPFLGNTVTAGISGRLGAGTTLGTSAAYLLGGRQATGVAGQRQALSTNTFLNFRLKRSLSGFVQYGFYRQQFDLSQTGLNLPRNFSRHSLRTGLTLSVHSR